MRVRVNNYICRTSYPFSAMAGSKDAEGFEEFDVNKLCDWLRSKKASEDIIIVVAGT